MSNYKIILLPTQKASNIAKDIIEGKFIYDNNITIDNRYLPHNLYLVEPEATIEVNDLFVSVTDKRPTSLEEMPYRCRDKFHKDNLLKDKSFVKVVASTDFFISCLGIALIEEEAVKEYISNPNLEIESVSIEWDYEDSWWADIKWKKEEPTSILRQSAIKWWKESLTLTERMSFVKNSSPKLFLDTITEEQIEKIFKLQINYQKFDTEFVNKPNFQEEESNLPKTKKEFVQGYNQRLKNKQTGWVYEGQNPFNKVGNYRVASTLQDYLESLGIDDSSDFEMWSEWFNELPDNTNNTIKRFDKVTFIPNLEVGEVEAIVLNIVGARVVLLVQDTIYVAGLDEDMYRPYPESRCIDLIAFAQKNYQ